MKRNSFLSVFLLILIVLAGCSSVEVKAPEPVSVYVPEPTVVIAEEVPEVFERVYDLDGYELTISASEDEVVVSYPSFIPSEVISTVSEAVVSDFRILEKATVKQESVGSIVLTGLTLEDVKNLTVFLDYRLEDYILLASDPSYSSPADLTVLEDLSVVYTVSTEAGDLVLAFGSDFIQAGFPEKLAEDEKQFLVSYLSDALNLSFDDEYKAVLEERLPLSEILAVVSVLDSEAAEYASTITVASEPVIEVIIVPEAIPEAEPEPEAPSPVPVAEAVSKAIESAKQIAEESVESVGTWFSANPMIVILGVVGFCILLGVLYYFTVHRLKNRKK